MAALDFALDDLFTGGIERQVHGRSIPLTKMEGHGFSHAVSFIYIRYNQRRLCERPFDSIEFRTACFVPYSHDSEEHKAWVLKLATRLMANGVDILLDQWDLSFGSDLPTFMESGLTIADRVLAICTDAYVKKANAPEGGVGYEKMILTAQMMANLSQTRIVPVLRSNEHAIVPTFLSTRIYLDFRQESTFEARYIDLIREIHGVAVQPRPPLGPNPFTNSQISSLAFRPERHVSPALSGTASFDYSSNNGLYVLGVGELAFDTKWTEAGQTSIYAYSDGTKIESFALAVGVSFLADLCDVSVFDNSSRVRTPTIGEIVIWKNRSGYYLATRIEGISVRSRGSLRDEVTISCMIKADRSPIFAR